MAKSNPDADRLARFSARMLQSPAGATRNIRENACLCRACGVLCQRQTSVVAPHLNAGGLGRDLPPMILLSGEISFLRRLICLDAPDPRANRVRRQGASPSIRMRSWAPSCARGTSPPCWPAGWGPGVRCGLSLPHSTVIFCLSCPGWPPTAKVCIADRSLSSEVPPNPISILSCGENHLGFLYAPVSVGDMASMTACRQPALKQFMSMIKRRNFRVRLVVGVMVAAYASVVFLGCHAWRLDFMGCTDSFQSLHLLLYAPAGLSFTAVSVAFYKNKEPRKTTLAYTGIVATVAVLASFAMSQIATVTHDTAIFCLTLMTVWISLLITKSSRGALLGWAIVAAFLAAVMVFAFPDHQVLVSLLYVLFAGGVALYATGASKLAEYSGIAVCVAILALVGFMAYAAVDEWGMVPPGYEWLLATEALSRAAPYAEGIMIVTGGFLGLAPFVALFTKDV